MSDQQLLPPDHPLAGQRNRSMEVMRPSVIDLEVASTPVATPITSPLVDLLTVLREHRWWLAVFTLLGLMVGFAVFIYRPRKYFAATTLELTGLNESFMNMNAVDPQAGTGSYSSNSVNIATQMRILESASIRGPVLDRLDRELTPMNDPQPDVFSKFRARLGLGNTDPLTSMKTGVAEANLTMNVRLMPSTRILILGCTSTNPDIAAAYVNTLASEYISQSLQYRTTNSQRTSQWLSGQLEETKSRLEQAENRLQDFVRRSGNTFVTENDTLDNSKLKQLQGDLAASQSDRIAKQTRYELARKGTLEALPEGAEDGNLQQYRQKLADLRRELANLTTTLTPDHPKVKRLNAQITSVENAMEKESAAVVRRINNEYEQAKAKERLLSNAYSAQAGAVSREAEKAAEYGMLKREVEMLRSSLNNMMTQANQATIVSAVPNSGARVVDQARATLTPVEPVLAYHIAYGLGGGFGSGVAFFFGLLRLRRSRESRTVGTQGFNTGTYKAPELGVIPSASLMQETAQRRWLPLKRRDEAAPDSTESQLELITWKQKTSMLAESFRLVVASLRFMEMPSGQKMRAVVVSSPHPSEGKTTVLTNLAFALAETGRRVVLVDADMRKPRLRGIFNLPAGRGLYDVLNPEVQWTGQEWATLAHPIGNTGVSVITAGHTESEEISRLLHSERLPQLVQYLQEHFDTVLIDTPPLLQFSDARLIASLTDGVVLVLRSGSTQRQSAATALTRLREDGIRVVGTVLNDWNPSEKSDSYHNYYHYYYGDHSKKK